MAWTSIPDSAIAVEADLDITLANLWVDDADFLFDEALRGGTFLVPKRLALARGSLAFQEDLEGQSPAAKSHITETAITFSSADDGDPNFTSAPSVIFGCENVTSTGLDWYDHYFQAHPYIVYGSLTATGFTLGCIGLRGNSTSGSTNTFQGIISWLAIGRVTSGE